MRAFDGAIFVRDAGVVARGRHAVVRHQILITVCQVLLRRLVEVAERRRQTVAAMFLRHAAECPQGVLQTLGQRHEAFAAQYDMSVREARERQPEVIQPVHQNDTSHRDVQRAGVGEVGQPHAAGFVFLAEDHISFRAMLSAPVRNAPLQRAADVWVQLRMPPPHLGQHADRADARRCLQDRHDIGLPDGGQRIQPPPCTWRRLL